MAILQSVLVNKSYYFGQYRDEISRLYKWSQSGLSKRAFLCHSHADRSLVEGLIVIFKEAGVDLYIDWLDNTMPEKPNKETAKKIQDKIIGAHMFLFLATANSKASRWCPWEIGFADASKKGIYIIPTEDMYSTYGNEYLDLYPKIDVGSLGAVSGYAVYQPGQNNGTWIQNALK